VSDDRDGDLPPDMPAATKIAVLEERLHALRREIRDQAVEYQRRLAELNHAHEKQVEDQRTYVSLDRYEGWQGEINSFKADVLNKLATLEGRGLGVMTARGLVMQVLPMVIAALAILAMFWRK
jgi:3-deoxy-D-arabino-heptulosonate 7-phosphate (DAHP) synthase